MTIPTTPWMALAFGGFLLCSCGQRTTSNLIAAPKTTFPVIGQVFVDGKPAQKLSVICHDIARLDQPSGPRPVGLTGEDGKIEFSTYQKADGVPAGEYVLTFAWREWDDYWKTFSGPDRLTGRYADPHKSTIRLIVQEKEPADLGTIELSTQ